MALDPKSKQRGARIDPSLVLAGGAIVAGLLTLLRDIRIKQEGLAHVGGVGWRLSTGGPVHDIAGAVTEWAP
ncbi:hypothetical protein, partial [Polyangium sp. 15x6]|uniref:hypothetical protein n=1 Tax=Polyangium sp. 15x6 TaxID=3042687 RepID=UPI00249C0F17